MMGFQEFNEAEGHKKGTYSALEMSPASAGILHDWVKENVGGDSLCKPTSYHCTLAYSRKGIPQAKSIEAKLPATGTPVGWELFKTQEGKGCLVLRVKSGEMDRLHGAYNEAGAQYDFPEYKPHVTVSYDFKGDVPVEFPTNRLFFDRHTFKGLDPDWSE